MHQLGQWNFSESDKKLVYELLIEWHSGRSLNSVLDHWEINNKMICNNGNISLKMLCYNVER
jgi:hypothetical protein